MSTDLTVVPPDPIKLYSLGQQVADVCKDIVLKSSCDIQGKRYVKVEGWQAIAATFGTTPEVVEGGVTFHEDGVMAEVVLKRDSDQTIISRAYGFVGYKEDPEAEKYAIIGKAQTRAVARVCRHKFSFVVVLIDPYLETTPADEVPRDGFKNKPKRSGVKTNLTGVLSGYNTFQSKDKKSWLHGGWIDNKYVWTRDPEIGTTLSTLSNKKADLTVGEEKTTKTGKPSFEVLEAFSAASDVEVENTVYQKEPEPTEESPDDNIPY